MKIIDFHTHIYPDRLADRATRATCDFYGLDTDQVGNIDTLLSRGRAAGVSHFVLLPVAVHPVGVRTVNAFIVEQCAAHPEFSGFGTVHPDMDAAALAEELDYIAASGLLGVKLHPDMQSIDTDDTRMDPICAWLSERDMPLFIHCGDEHRDHSHPRRLRRLIDRFPDLTVIAAHLGGWSKWDEALDCLKDTACYLDVSSCQKFLSPEQFLYYIRSFGSHRLLFGTDFPIWDPATEVRAIEALPLTEEEKKDIFYRNGERLLRGY